MIPTVFMRARCDSSVTREMTDHEQRKRSSLDVEIIQAVAEQTAVEPESLPPLYECIDPDALNSLFVPTRTADRQSGSLVFSYAECLIAVSFGRDLTITVTEEDASTRSKTRSVDAGCQFSFSEETVR